MPAGTPTQIGLLTNGSADPSVITLSPVNSGANAGDLVVVIGHNAGVTYSNCTDSRGNTYTRTINNSGGGFCGVLIAWAVIAAGKDLVTNDTISVTDGFGGVHECIQVIQVSSIAGSPLDQSSVNTASATTWTSNATPTTVQADDFLVGAVSVNGASNTPNQPAGWTGSPTTPTVSVAGTLCGRRDYENVAATGAYAYNAGFSAGTNTYAAGIIAFKASGGGAAAVAIPAIPVRIPNRNVGPNVMRFLYRQPTRAALPTEWQPPDTIVTAPNLILPNNRVGPPAMRQNTRRQTWLGQTSKTVVQVFTVAAGTTATFQLQTNKIISATASSSASFIKQVNKNVFSATASSAATFQNQVNKILSATSGTTATFQKQVNKILSATSSTTATFQRQVNKLFTISASSAVTFQKQVNKLLTVTAPSTATFIAGKVWAVAMTATSSTLATFNAVFQAGGSVVARLRSMMGVGE